MTATRPRELPDAARTKEENVTESTEPYAAPPPADGGAMEVGVFTANEVDEFRRERMDILHVGGVGDAGWALEFVRLPFDLILDSHEALRARAEAAEAEHAQCQEAMNLMADNWMRESKVYLGRMNAAEAEVARLRELAERGALVTHERAGHYCWFSQCADPECVKNRAALAGDGPSAAGHEARGVG